MRPALASLVWLASFAAVGCRQLSGIEDIELAPDSSGTDGSRNDASRKDGSPADARE